MSEQEIRKLLAIRLKECREKSGLTIRDVGDAIGKSEKTISAWEHGRGQPDADMLFKLCRLYNIRNINIFYGMDSDSQDAGASDEKYVLRSQEERELILNFRSVNDEGKRHILETARLVAGNPDMQKETSAKMAM